MGANFNNCSSIWKPSVMSFVVVHTFSAHVHKNKDMFVFIFGHTLIYFPLPVLILSLRLWLCKKSELYHQAK